jgi:hypothetical protein
MTKSLRGYITFYYEVHQFKCICHSGLSGIFLPFQRDSRRALLAGIDMSYGSQGRMKTSVVPSCPKSSVGHPFF